MEEARRIPAVADILKELEEFQEAKQKKPEENALDIQRSLVLDAIDSKVRELKSYIGRYWMNKIDEQYLVEVQVQLKFLLEDVVQELKEQGWKDIYYNAQTQTLFFRSHELSRKVFTKPPQNST